MIWALLCLWHWEGLRPEATRGQLCIKREERKQAVLGQGAAASLNLRPQPEEAAWSSEEAMLGNEVKRRPWATEPTAGSCVCGALCPQPGGTHPAVPALEAELPAPFSVPEMGRTTKTTWFWMAPLQTTQTASKAGLQALEQNQEMLQREKRPVESPLGAQAEQRSRWVCVPAPGCPGFVPQGLGHGAKWDLHFHGTGDVRGLHSEVPRGCKDKGDLDAWKQQRSRKQRRQVLKSNAFRVLSHRYTNTRGVAEAYFHPEAPPHVPDLLGCVCC